MEARPHNFPNLLYPGPYNSFSDNSQTLRYTVTSMFIELHKHGQTACLCIFEGSTRTVVAALHHILHYCTSLIVISLNVARHIMCLVDKTC